MTNPYVFLINTFETNSAPPEWINEPFDTFTQEGESVEIQCTASGVPVPTIKWLSGK